MVYSCLLLLLVFVYASDLELNTRLRKTNVALRHALSVLSESQVGSTGTCERPKSKEDCTCPPEPTCELCEGVKDFCNGGKYVQTTIAEPQFHFLFGCSYPEEYSYPDSCPTEFSCVPCVCNKHDYVTGKYTECAAEGTPGYWRYGPKYITCYDDYTFRKFGFCEHDHNQDGYLDHDSDEHDSHEHDSHEHEAKLGLDSLHNQARWEQHSYGAWGELSWVDKLRNCNEVSGFGSKKIEPCSVSLSCEHGSFPARNCIDGDENTMCHSCDGRSGTLTLRLPEKSVVSAIRIKNRSFARERIIGAKVKIDGVLCSDVDGNAFVGNLKKNMDRNDIDDVIYMDCGNTRGSTVTITSQNNKELQMMEVKVMEPCDRMIGGEYSDAVLRDLRATYPDYRKFQC